MEKLPNKSRERALEILAAHLRGIEETCADQMQAVVLTGSLVTGSYTGDAGSDVDLVHVLRDDAPADARQSALACIAQTEAQTGRDLPISRCVYRVNDLYPPYPVDFELCLENKDYLELPIELLRMKDASRVVWGELDVQDIPQPTRADVVACKERSAQWARQLAESGMPLPPQDDLPTRLIVQSVLVRALLDVFFATGRSCSNKSEVARRLQDEVANYAFLPLVEACTRWRYAPEAFTAADEQLIQAQWPLWRAFRRESAIDAVPRGMLRNSK